MTLEEKILKAITSRAITCDGCKESVVKEIVKAIEETLPKEKKCKCGKDEMPELICECGAKDWNDCLQEVKKRIKNNHGHKK